MDTEHVTAVCTGLGSLREDANGRDVYVKHDDCLVNLKHLQRFLRRDDPTEREIFMQLGKWNTIRQDILPIIIHYRDDYDLVLNAVKVMVFLTMPIDPSSSDIPRQLEHLRQFKEAVLEDDAIGVIVSHLQDPLAHMESGTLTDTDGKMFQLVLTLIRNLLAVDDPSSPLVRASVVDSQQALYVKDALIERLFSENAMDLLLALTQHVGGEQPFLRQDNLLILEILNYLLAGQMPDVIASAREKVQKQPKSQLSGAVLEALMTKEREQRRSRSFGGPRHSNFCGMFVRVGKDGFKTIITRNPYQSPLDNLFQKPEIKRGLVKKVATDLPLHVRSNSTVCAMLRGFADQLLEGNYNLLMQTIKSDIRSERSNVQSQDIVMFFAVANFFTAYQRCLLTKRKGDEDVQQSRESQNPTEDSGAVFQGRCGRIASTMDEDMFILVTMKWQAFVESAKESNEWFPATSSGALLKEMIHMLDYILKASDQNTTEGQQEIRVARILLMKVFYDHTEYGILPFIFRLMKTFDIHRQPRSQLAGLIEMTHIVLRLLDSITKQDGALRVKKKARNTKKKNPEASEPAVEGTVQEEANNAAASSETQLGSQDSNGNVPVVNALHSENGAINLGPEVAAVEGHDDDTEEVGNDDAQDKEERGGEENEVHSEEEEEMPTKEETLDVHKCVRMFAENTILHNYCWLLKNYLHNTPVINYYIVRMLQRICEDLMMEPMLYQLGDSKLHQFLVVSSYNGRQFHKIPPMLSILQTCYEVLSNSSIRNSEQHQFVIAFLTKLVRHLFQKLKTSPMLFVDLLFWKSKQDCHCITANYAIHDLKKHSRGGKHMSKDRRALLNSLGDDDDDHDDDDMGNNNAPVQDRRALLNSLGDDDDDDAKMPGVETLFRSMDSNEEKGKVKRQKAVKKKGPFTDFSEDLIKDLFERFKENHSCSKLIAEGLEQAGAVQESGEPFTPAQVGRALKRLGLARVVGKKTTQNELLRNIRSQSDSENVSGSDNEGDVQGENIEIPASGSDEEMSDDEGNRQDGVGGEKKSSKATDKKRKSGGTVVNDGTSKRRRRTGLFSEEQDHKIQSLFEKYKGMTRFKHLIVSDLDGVFTTAQIGRRLQQLGCVEPRKRKSKLAKMSEDEDEAQRSTPGSGEEHTLPSEKKDGIIVRHSSEGSKECGLPIGSAALKASWGPSARKNAPVRKSVQHADSSDDDVPIAQHHSMRSIFQKRRTCVDDESHPQEQVAGESTGTAAGEKDLWGRQSMSCEEDSHELKVPSAHTEQHESDDDQSIEDSLAEVVPKTFQRRRFQSGNEPIMLIDSEMEKSGDSDSGEDEQIEKTYERKRPSVEPKLKSSTWGDSETDASDIEDTQDLATALQEVRIFENQLATKSKKRRLARRQTMTDGEVDGASEEGDPSDDPTSEAPPTSGRTKKALLVAMASDEDE